MWLLSAGPIQLAVSAEAPAHVVFIKSDYGIGHFRLLGWFERSKSDRLDICLGSVGLVKQSGRKQTLSVIFIPMYACLIMCHGESKQHIFCRFEFVACL